MKRVVALCGLMFWLGLSAAPRATVAGRDETLSLLCMRFQIAAEPELQYRTRVAAELLRTGDQAGHMAAMAAAQSLEAVREMVCITARPSRR